MITNTTKLTLDTDNGRYSSSPSVVVANSGRMLVFYEKFFTSGLTGYSSLTAHITSTPPLTINIPAGSGNVNGSSISWGSDTRVLPIDSFILVYADSMGLHYVTSWTMEDIASSVVLAYINVGHTAIVTVEEVEKTGRGIYIRKQELSGSDWVWTDEEIRLSTGEQPSAFYDSSLDKVFLSYKKDSVVYLRVFDLSSELTWRYLPNTQNNVGVITLNHQPDINLTFQTASASRAVSSITNLEIYPISVTGMCFRLVGLDYKPFIFLPFILTPNTNLQYLNYPYYIEVCSKSGSTYTVEASYSFNANGAFSADRWVQWSGSLGVKYVRLRATCPVLIQGDVVTPEANYKQVEVFDPFEKQTVDGNTINEIIIADELTPLPSAGMRSLLTKTFEYIDSRDFEQDSITFQTASGMRSVLAKTSEYEESRDFEQDSITFQTAAGIKSLMIVTNT
jgi:hypothetical protein